MIRWILFVTSLFILLIFLFLTLQAAKPTKDMVLGVVLPPDGQEAPQVQALTARYRRRVLQLILALVCLALPLLFLPPYSSVHIIFFFFWLSAALLVMSTLFTRFHDLLVQVKRTEGWRKQRREPETRSKAIPYHDESDDAWRHGLLFYADAKNSRLWVKKQVGGYGLTLNFGGKRGKILAGITLSALAVFFVGLSALLLWFDFGAMGLTEQNGVFTAYAPMYHSSFTQGEIKSILFLENTPAGKRMNGVSVDLRLFGRFSLEGYGRASLYLYRQNPPYLAVELTDGWVFLNGQTPEETQAYYKLLDGEVFFTGS